MVPEPIEAINKKIFQICNLIGELEPEFQIARPRADRARIKFPWGTIQKATVYRNLFPFIQDRIINTNIAYTLQLTDILRWILNWFDLKGVAREMMIKNGVLLFACVMEAMTYDFVKHYVPERVNSKYSRNLKKLLKFGIINQEQFDEFEKCRRMRDDIHLHRLKRPERKRYTSIDYIFAFNCMMKMRHIFTRYYQFSF